MTTKKNNSSKSNCELRISLRKGVICTLIFSLMSAIGCSEDSVSQAPQNSFVSASSITSQDDGSVIYDRPTYKGFRISRSSSGRPNGELYCKWQNLNLIDEIGEMSDDVSVYFDQKFSTEKPNTNPIEGPLFNYHGPVIRAISCGK